MSDNFSVVDLFCGVGGLTHGFYLEEFKIDAGVDFDKSCKYAYEVNNLTKFIHEDLTILSSEEIEKLFSGKRKILVGCAPCQAFSQYNKNDKNDKWKLVYAFGRIIDKIKPEIISMENVPQLKTYMNGKVFDDFLNILKKNNYHIEYQIVNAQLYGVPQRRNRLILLASRIGEIKLIEATHNQNNYVTVRDSILHLPEIHDGETCKTDKLHRARKLTILNKKRIKATPEGGSWKDWKKNLILDCHKKETGKSYGSVYGRMKWDDVSPTLTTQCTGYGNGRYGHPEQDRAISLREAAILQSFPEYYDFIDPLKPFTPTTIEKQIGNAVPVRLAQAIAKSIKKHIQDFHD
ncbi:MAG: DNA (cytosine-5-)-methyltransferase [Bacteroidales bacterium]|nr:DNA (cytosine-5-)-methyltransferase [Bacteroidales bacterium]